jgi:hypothetical protein
MYKVKGNIYSPDIPDSSEDFTQVNPWYMYWNSIMVLSYWGECSVFAVDATHIVSYYLFSFHQVILTAGRPESM